MNLKQDLKKYYDSYLETHPYQDMKNINPIKPFAIWGTTNKELDNFYKQPEINLTDSKDDVNIKPTMRHIVGLANVMKEYQNPQIAKVLGLGKEGIDILRLDLDNKLDWENDKIGIDYAKENPNYTMNDVMQYAYEQALKNYERDYGYKYPKASKEVNAKIGDEIIPIILDAEQLVGESTTKPQTVHLYNFSQKNNLLCVQAKTYIKIHKRLSTLL